MNEIKDRIKKIRKDSKLTQSEFGKMLGVSRDVIGNIEYGRVEPKELFINYLCREFNVNKKWIETGEGEIYIVTSEDEALAEALANLSLTTNKDMKMIAEKLTKLSDKNLNLINKLIDSILE